MKRKLGYYPGCGLHSTAAEFDWSLQAVFGALDMELTEVPDWSCCGASSGHSLNAHLADSLVLRNLILAEVAGLKELIVPCAACYNLLKGVDVKAREGREGILKANEQLKSVLGKSYNQTVEVLHPLQPLSQPELLAAIEKKAVNPLSQLKIVTYYGCLLTRPSYVAFDHTEYPVAMDKVLASTGAEVRKWSYKTDCCGASLALPRADVVEKFTVRFVEQARRAGADAIVVACPVCQANLDTRQSSVANPMPIFYFSELIGLSLGHPDVKKWAAKHIVDPLPLLKRLNLL
jgi:heterodisulfide reductase subunit B